MKTLTLFRHATANNKQLLQHDSDRKLSELGQLQAKSVAMQLRQKNCFPDYIICSPTKRTMKTATILCDLLQLNPPFKTDNTIYTGDLEEILAILSCLRTPCHLFLVGHNPIISCLAHELCNAATKMHLPNFLPPAGVVSLEFDMENWDELEKTKGKLLFFIKPDHEPK